MVDLYASTLQTFNEGYMIYAFECDCGSKFDVSCPMSAISDLKPECPNCGKKKGVYRDFSSILFIAPQKTLGSLAEKNSRGMSEDHKNHLNKKFNEYKNQPFTGKLPEKAKIYKRNKDGKRIPRDS
jgi:hypothetical protein